MRWQYVWASCNDSASMVEAWTSFLPHQHQQFFCQMDKIIGLYGPFIAGHPRHMTTESDEGIHMFDVGQFALGSALQNGVKRFLKLLLQR